MAQVCNMVVIHVLAFMVLSMAGAAGPTYVVSWTDRAFAARQMDGSVATWGRASNGGDSSSVAAQLTNVEVITGARGGAFAAKKSDGTVVTWGVGDGGNSASVSAQLTNVDAIYTTGRAFAAVKTDGTVVTWGHPGRSGQWWRLQQRRGPIDERG